MTTILYFFHVCTTQKFHRFMPKEALPHLSCKSKLQSLKGVLMQLTSAMTGAKESNECMGCAHLYLLYSG